MAWPKDLYHQSHMTFSINSAVIIYWWRDIHAKILSISNQVCSKSSFWFTLPNLHPIRNSLYQQFTNLSLVSSTHFHPNSVFHLALPSIFIYYSTPHLHLFSSSHYYVSFNTFVSKYPSCFLLCSSNVAIRIIFLRCMSEDDLIWCLKLSSIFHVTQSNHLTQDYKMIKNLTYNSSIPSSNLYPLIISVKKMTTVVTCLEGVLLYGG
jgi:hypothetical protein